MPVGRPTKYKPEYCQQLIDHMSQGYPLDTFATVINVNVDSLYEWRDKHPEFSEAIKNGRAASLKWFLDLGRAGAAGKLKGFNPAPWIFMMKNMHKWRDRQEIEHTGGSKPIKFENLKDEDIKNRIKDALEILGATDDKEE